MFTFLKGGFNMVKILGVCGSPRNASTNFSLKMALKAASEVEGVEVELVELRGRKINFCIHCNKCVKDEVNYCKIYNDDMNELYEKVYQADGFIMASPVYEMNITGQMATFFNRFRPTYTILKKDAAFFGRKVGGAIAVGGTRNGGQESTINAINGFYNTQGIVPVNGALGIYAGASVWSKDQGAAGAEADEVGMENCRKIGKKVAEMAKLLQEQKH